MKFKFNGKGINRMIKWGLPIIGLVVANIPGCIIGLILSSIISVSEDGDNKAA